MLTMLGIPNCDTVRKAKTFLETNDVAFQFRDIRKNPLDEAEWRALAETDAEGKLINTRSPSFRKTGVGANELDAARKVEVLLAQPTAMKRPAMVQDGQLKSVGFSQDLFQSYL